MKELKQYCSAKTRSGEPCKHPAGFRTPHFGRGRCWLHGGLSTGPRTEEGKASVGQNRRTHGLYSKVLTGADEVRFKAVQEFSPGEILEDGFYLIHAKVLGLLEGEGTFSKQAKTVLAACEILVENGDLDIEFVEELRLRLLGLDVSALSKILNSTTNLANSAKAMSRMGDITRQFGITKNFIIQVLRLSNDRTARQLAINTIGQLKLDAGMPSEELDALLQEIPELEDEEDVHEENQDNPEEDSPEEARNEETSS